LRAFCVHDDDAAESAAVDEEVRLTVRPVVA
jgi:hypothetical protein